MMRCGPLSVFERLHEALGPQHWWPGDTPFEIMVGAILTQNTAWSNVERAIDALDRAGALDARPLIALSERELAALIRPAGYFNVKARRLRNYVEWYIAHGEYDGLSSQDTAALRAGLLSINGIGPETADDILLYAFERPVFVIDAYTRRLVTRLGWFDEDPGYEPLRRWFERRLGAAQRRDLVATFNEYHALIVVHGKSVCRPRPLCDSCALARNCRYFRGGR
jgi:endonuclease III related protein